MSTRGHSRAELLLVNNRLSSFLKSNTLLLEYTHSEIVGAFSP